MRQCHILIELVGIFVCVPKTSLQVRFGDTLFSILSAILRGNYIHSFGDNVNDNSNGIFSIHFNFILRLFDIFGVFEVLEVFEIVMHV